MRPRLATIRPYRPSDRAFYARSLEALQDHLVGVDPFHVVQRGPQYGKKYSASALRTLRRNRGSILIAEVAGRQVGFVASYVRPPHPIRDLELRPRRQGFIMDLYVVPGARGTGIGTALLNAARRRLVRSGCTHVFLDVFAPNVRAHALYRSLGFRDFGVVMMAASGRPGRPRRHRGVQRPSAPLRKTAGPRAAAR